MDPWIRMVSVTLTVLVTVDVVLSRQLMELILYNVTGSWNQAKEFCEDQNLSLLEPRSPMINDVIRKARNGVWFRKLKADAWIGLHIPNSANTTADSFQWLNGCQAVAESQKNWARNLPTDLGASCVKLSRTHAKWSLESCQQALFVICANSTSAPCILEKTNNPFVASNVTLEKRGSLEKCKAHCLHFKMGLKECWHFEYEHITNWCTLHLSDFPLPMTQAIYPLNSHSYRKVCYTAVPMESHSGQLSSSANDAIPITSCTSTPNPADVTSPRHLTDDALEHHVTNSIEVTVKMAARPYAERSSFCPHGLVNFPSPLIDVQLLSIAFGGETNLTEWGTAAWVKSSPGQTPQCSVYNFSTKSTSAASCDEHHPFLCQSPTEEPCTFMDGGSGGFFTISYVMVDTMDDCKAKCNVSALRSKPCLAVSWNSNDRKCYLSFRSSIFSTDTLDIEGSSTSFKFCLRGGVDHSNATVSTHAGPDVTEGTGVVFSSQTDSSEPSTPYTSMSFSVQLASTSEATSPSSACVPSGNCDPGSLHTSAASTDVTSTSSISSSPSSLPLWPSSSLAYSLYSLFQTDTFSTPAPSSVMVQHLDGTPASLSPGMSTSRVSQVSPTSTAEALGSSSPYSTSLSSSTARQAGHSPATDVIPTLGTSVGGSLGTHTNENSVSLLSSTPSTSSVEDVESLSSSVDVTLVEEDSSTSVAPTRSPEPLCQCRRSTACLKNSDPTLLVNAVHQMAKELAANLTVPANQTAKAKRGKISSPDSRRSAQTMGYAGIAFIAVILVLLVSSDVITFAVWFSEVWKRGKHSDGP